jgi:hypothetical protein
MIYDIKKKTCVCIKIKFKEDGIRYRDSEVIENVIYTTSVQKPIIHKFAMTGKYIGKIILDETYWCEVMVKILKNEIITVRENIIKYYDSDGNFLRSQMKKSKEKIINFIATPNYIYTVNTSNMLNKYKRVP